MLVAMSSEVVLWGGIILALTLKSWYPLLLSLLGIAVAIFTHGSTAILIPTDSKKISRARIRAVFELLVIFSVVVVSYLLFGSNV